MLFARCNRDQDARCFGGFGLSLRLGLFRNAVQRLVPAAEAYGDINEADLIVVPQRAKFPGRPGEQFNEDGFRGAAMGKVKPKMPPQSCTTSTTRCKSSRSTQSSKDWRCVSNW